MQFSALPTELVTRWRSGEPDANGQMPERATSDGEGNPCRHCLCNIPKGAGMLILAHRPFDGLHPYAELGPIFVCAEECPRGGGADLPAILTTSPDYLIKGYSADNRIVYGTGRIVPKADFAARAAAVFADRRVVYLHARSARNNCYLARIDPA